MLEAEEVAVSRQLTLHRFQTGFLESPPGDVVCKGARSSFSVSLDLNATWVADFF